MLRRKFYEILLKWSKEKNQECLLVRGARQIGKTYIIDYFGRNNYKSYIYLNYICLFDYLFISSQMSAKPYFIGSTGILLLW